MTLRYAGPFNGYLPQATGQVVAFIRKESEFPLNRWVQYIPTPVKNAAYVQIETDQPVRMYDDATMGWEDGASRKHMGKDNKVAFAYVPFRTFRRNRTTELGHQTIEQTKDFQIKPLHMDTVISQIMVNRTKRCVDLIETSSVFGNNVDTANSLNGGAGKWSTASDDKNSPNYNAIFKTILKVAQLLHLLTNGKVKASNLRILISPGAAIKIAPCSEITDYCRESPYSKQILENGQDEQYNRWGLPARFKGFEFVVEDTMRVDQQAKADGTQATVAHRGYLKADDSAIFLTRIGGLDGEYGSPSYSTIQLYHFGPLLKVEAFDDPEDQLVRIHGSEDTKELISTSLSGFKVTGIV